MVKNEGCIFVVFTIRRDFCVRWMINSASNLFDLAEHAIGDLLLLC